jgi:hypothetical protein
MFIMAYNVRKTILEARTTSAVTAVPQPA